ncbi:MAG: signal peptidase I [Candidatus Pacearchaeota archaeon]|nr:MAG: signal peptidase I [Candidatus Pacearchaeota archaeon]
MANIKSVLKKTWDFLWHSNSIWSWIVDLILVFLIVKFIIFPLFGLILCTPLPFVIIESHSMEHEGNFDSWFSLHGQWYLDNDITKEQVREWSWNKGLDKGDIIVVKGEESYELGNVIIFKIQEQATPIIHRIVEVKSEDSEIVFETKGDHNDGQWPYEENIGEEQILGKAAVRIPKLGWVKLFFVELFR